MGHAVVAARGVRVMLDAFGRLGLDPAELRHASALDEIELANPDGELPRSNVYRMWEVAAQQWPRPGLGLAAGAIVPFGAYDLLDYLLATAATLGDGIRGISNYFALATRTAEYVVREEGSRVACAMVWRIPPEGVVFELRDYTLAVLASHVNDASGFSPVRVDLQGPSIAGPADYETVFHAPTTLNATRSALVYSRRAWDAPLARRDAVLHQTLQRHAELLLERSSRPTGESVVDRVRGELLHRARVGLPALDDVARAIGIGERTLQRQLRSEGTTFASLVDEVRGSLAREYLRDPGVTISEVAYLLGFSEPSAFSRAFRRWTGKSPRAFRTAAQR